MLLLFTQIDTPDLVCLQAVVDLEQQLGEKARELQAAERVQQEAHEAFLTKK